MDNKIGTDQSQMQDALEDINQAVQAVINTLRSSADSQKFSKLFDLRDSTGYKELKDMEIALCKMIAATATKMGYTDVAEIVDAAFRESNICCRQWDTDTYRNEIIATALKAIQTQSRPPYIEVQRLSEKRCVERINTALLAKYIKRTVAYKVVRDETSQRVSIFLYQNGVYREAESNYMKGIIRSCIEEYSESMVTAPILDNTFKLILTHTDYIALGAFNADENIVNFQNGILMLDTMRLVPHSPKYLSTVQIPCDWTDTPCETPVFDRYMETLTAGREDVKHFLMQYIGMCLSNVYGYRLKKALVLVGEGNTGKSQLKLLIERILGDRNFFAIDLKTLEARFGTSYIVGKRLAGCSDMGFVSLAELRTFKQVTGGDNIIAEAKNDKGFSFIYKGLLMFGANALPKFSGDDGPWVYERFCIVDCPNVVPAAQRDRHLLDKMYAERQGIIHKALLALKELIDDDFAIQEPKCVIEMRQKYMQLNNPISRFMEECIIPYVKTPTSKQETKMQIYYIFSRWCNSNNNGYKLSHKEFSEKVAQYLGKPESDVFKRTADGIVMDGYTLSDESNIYL